MLNHNDGKRDVTEEVYVQYSYYFEKQRVAKVWEFILDQIVMCFSGDVPNLEKLRCRFVQAHPQVLAIILVFSAAYDYYCGQKTSFFLKARKKTDIVVTKTPVTIILAIKCRV